MTTKTKHNIDLSTEDGHQYAVIRWSQQESVRTRWPELALLYHVENERQCSPQQAARRKRMGVKRGVPDLVLPVARGGYHGLYIELKTPVGKPTKEQMWWTTHLQMQGYYVEVCYGWERATKLLEWYLGGASKCP